MMQESRTIETLRKPLNVHQERPVVLANALTVVADLDQTLVFTKNFHRDLVVDFVTAKFPDISERDINERYSALRGQAYSQILNGIRELCEEGSRVTLDVDQFTGDFFDFVRSIDTSDDRLASVAVVPGAPELLEQIKALDVPLVVCTGSPRVLAELFLTRAGLDDLVLSDRLYCWGDSEYSKADPEFWNNVLGTIDRSQVIALDDHPHSIEYVLGAGQIAGVIVVPSVTEQSFDDLNWRYPGQVKLLQGSWDHW